MATTVTAVAVSTIPRSGPSPIEGTLTYDMSTTRAGTSQTHWFDIAGGIGTPLPLRNAAGPGAPLSSFLSERIVESSVTVAGQISILYSLPGDLLWNAIGRAKLYKFSPRNQSLTLVAETTLPRVLATTTQTALVTPPTPVVFVRGDRIWVQMSIEPTDGTVYGSPVATAVRMVWGTTTINAKFQLVFTETFTMMLNATNLYPRRTAGHTVGGNFFDWLPTKGASANTTGVRNTAAGGTELQWTRTAGGTILEWISPRFKQAFSYDSPDGTLSMAFSVIASANESNASANVGLRFKVFRRSKLGVETLIATSTSSAELGTTLAYNNPTMLRDSYTPTSFYADDRLVLRAYVVNVGTMAGGFTATIGYDATTLNAVGETYLTFYNIEDFKAEGDPDTPETVPDGMSTLGLGN